MHCTSIESIGVRMREVPSCSSSSSSGTDSRMFLAEAKVHAAARSNRGRGPGSGRDWLRSPFDTEIIAHTSRAAS